MNTLNNLLGFTISDDVFKYYDYKFADIDYEKLKKDNTNISISSLKEMLIPFNDASIKHHETSLIHIKRHNEENVWYKLENENITGSFKDRESIIGIKYALLNNIPHIYICSSGNAAISYSYFANKYGLKCTCYIPKDTSKVKIDKIRELGSDLHLFNGEYSFGYRKLVDMNLEGLNVTPCKFSLQSEGIKAIALEIFIQLGYTPDYIFVPIGNGTCFTSIWKGFYDLYSLDLINKIPYMIGVTHSSTNIIQHCLNSKVASYMQELNVKSLHAEGIIGKESFAMPKILSILLNNSGKIITVNDSEIKKAYSDLNDLDKLIIEPTSATALAAYYKAGIPKHATKVIILTGGNTSDGL